MNAQKNSQAQAIKEQIMVFQFSETKNEVRTLIDNGEVYFVGSDVAKTLGYKEPHKAIVRHCRYGMKRAIPHPQNPTKQLQVLTIPEGDVFRLIIHSELESAQKFESWVMDEVLPALRKKGYYSLNQRKEDFIDMRDVPPSFTVINEYDVCTMYVENSEWYSVNDVHRAIHCSTSAAQTAKKLNAKRTLAMKIYTYGATNPSWFTNAIGLQLILGGSRTLKYSNQLKLAI